MPEVTLAQLQAADFDELFCLTAKARFRQELWSDVLATAIAKVLPHHQ